jgi:magnesium transporter
MAIKEQLISSGLNWIDIIDPNVGEMEELSKQYGLNHHTVKDCLEPEHLPKYELDNDVHFLILRFYAHQFDTKIATIQELTNKIAIFYTDRFLITIHKAATPFLDVIRRKHVEPKKCTTTTEVLTKIVWNALETFDDPANRLSEQVDFYENQVILKRTDNDLVEALYTIKRQASISHKVLMLMQEPINHLSPKPGEEAALQDVRDQHLKMHTLYNQVLEDVNNLLNLTMSFAAQRTNEVMRILTLFSVFFMPLTFIAGIYGMNFEFMPELSKKWGYPAVLVVMAIVTGIIYQWFKRKKWL